VIKIDRFFCVAFVEESPQTIASVWHNL